MFLRDEELHALLQPPNGVIDPIDFTREDYAAEHQIQPSSVDLTIGEIHVPPGAEIENDDPLPYVRQHSLEPGQTAFVVTFQTCRFADDIGAIGFPPASLSAKGIITTNPGHVDPGYEGKLSFTVINMGRKTLELRHGDAIVSLLLFRLDQPATRGYGGRKPGPHGGASKEILGRLSPEFLDVSAKAAAAAEGAERKTRTIGYAVPIVIAVLTLGGVYVQTTRANDDEIKKLEGQIQTLKLDLEKRLAPLEAK